MKSIKAFLQQALTLLRRQPFGAAAVLTGLVAAVFAALLPWKLTPIVNAITLAVGRKIAATGSTELGPIRADALSLTIWAAATMLLYLFAIWAALRCARSVRTQLRATVQDKRKQHEAEGHMPPPDWEKDVGRDIDHLCASIAAAPEWLMLLSGVVFCVGLLIQLPLLPALMPPITALLACYIRDALRMRKAARSTQTAAVAAVWAAMTLAALAYMLLQTDPVLPLGAVVLELLAMTCIVPAALQLPYRNLRPTGEALTRIRGFLK